MQPQLKPHIAERTDYASQLGFIRYVGTEYEDHMIVKWWLKMRETDEFDAIFPKDYAALSNFFSLFRKPNALFYILDNISIWFAAWVVPFESSAILGMWVSPEYRGTRHQLDATRFCYDTLFQIFPTILGFTKREEVLAIHKHIGYTVLCKIPKFFDAKDDVWMVCLTKEAYENGALKK